MKDIPANLILDMASFILHGGDLIQEEDILYREMSNKGHEIEKIEAALDWFLKVYVGSDLYNICGLFVQENNQNRVLSEEESLYIPDKIFQYITSCLNKGLIDGPFYEELINKLVLLNANEFTMEEVKSLIILTIAENYRVNWQKRVVNLQFGKSDTIH